MPRSRPRTSTVEVIEDSSLDRIIASWVSKLLVLAPPWVCGLLVVAAGALFHHLWGGRGAGARTAWAVLGLSLSTVVLTGMTWLVSHQRRPLGRIHSTATVFLASLYVMIATITGITQPVVVFFELVFGSTLALSWDIRVVIRAQDPESGVRDPLTQLWERAREVSGFDGTRATMKKVADHKIDAQIKIENPDKTVEDLQKKTLNMETAMGLPPGSLTISADQNRADLAAMSISDPRILQNTLAYPGPLHPGGSIADAIRLGLYQDMDPVDLVFLGYHLMINGMSGSGKSFGGGWNILASLMSRKDVSIIAADLTKADQTLGDAAEAIDWLVFTKAQANALMDGLQRAVPARTAWLSAHGHKKWERGCGLQAVYILLEECPDVLRVVDEDDFVQLAKAARSAGIYLILSLQRSDYSQIPTVVRGQFAAMMCFGVASGDDAAFGLPEKVISAGASPEDWGADFPGMCYLSAPGIPMAKRIMPIRTYLIEPKTMQELAAEFPASARPLDEVTAKAFGEVHANRVPPVKAVQLIRQQAGADTETEAQDAAPAAAQAAPEPAEAAPRRPDRGRPLCVAAELVISVQHASAQMLARKMRIEATYAERLMDLLEDRGVVGAAGADGKRDVLIRPEELEATVAGLADADAEDGNAFEEAVSTPDPSPDMHVDVDDDAAVAPPADGEDLDWEPEPEPARRMTPEDARTAFIEQLRAWKRDGKGEITGPDLKPLRERTGMSRAWGKKMLDLAARDGILHRDPVKPLYRFTEAPIDVDDRPLVGAP